jgi:catechol 2,3-dioxygenase-like lactoylglutathione lyase family enzyme
MLARMLANEELIAFAATTDPSRARDFYGGTLGLEIVEITPYACVFRVRKTLLRVAVVDRVEPVPYTVLGWAVRDIGEIVRELAAHGVPTLRYDGMDQDELGIWKAPSGSQVAWFRDPDGNTLSLTQVPGRPGLFSR